MNIPDTIKDLFLHMEWADALVWQSVNTSAEAVADEDLRIRLHHIHLVQRAFLKVWGGQPVNPEMGGDLRGEALAAWGREYHQEVGLYLSGLPELDLDRPIELPWAEFITARIGKTPKTPTFGETLIQIASHSSYHRGQVNMRLRELGIEPPLVDFIAWVWLGKPGAQW